MTSRPTGTVTFLFTDIENSTQLAREHPETWEAARLDVTRACLDAFGTAASGGAAFPITTSEMVHGAAVTEAVVRSATSKQVEKIG